MWRRPAQRHDGDMHSSHDRGTAVTAGTLRLPGARIAYEVTGDGPVIVLIHGFGLDMRMWDRQVAQLADRFQVVRYDCRGFGSSGPMDYPVPYTHAGDLLALLDHLAVADAVVAGLSFGGRVALQCALAAPTRVRGLMLLDAVLDGIVWDERSTAAMDEVARQVEAHGVAAGLVAWRAHPLFDAARKRPELAAELADMVADYPGQHWLGLDAHEPVRPAAIDVLEELAMPALVLSGELDVPCFREMSAVLASRIPLAQSAVIAGAGHMINMEAPGVVNELMIQFADGLDQPSGRNK
jgi:3-oxoadipate enol-lactonase